LYPFRCEITRWYTSVEKKDSAVHPFIMSRIRDAGKINLRSENAFGQTVRVGGPLLQSVCAHHFRKPERFSAQKVDRLVPHRAPGWHVEKRLVNPREAERLSAIRTGSYRFVLTLDLYWRSPESSDLWYKSG